MESRLQAIRIARALETLRDGMRSAMECCDQEAETLRSMLDDCEAFHARCEALEAALEEFAE